MCVIFIYTYIQYAYIFIYIVYVILWSAAAFYFNLGNQIYVLQTASVTENDSDESAEYVPVIYYGDLKVNIGQAFKITCIIPITAKVHWLKNGESITRHNLRHGRDDHSYVLSETAIEGEYWKQGREGQMSDWLNWKLNTPLDSQARSTRSRRIWVCGMRCRFTMEHISVPRAITGAVLTTYCKYAAAVAVRRSQARQRAAPIRQLTRWRPVRRMRYLRLHGRNNNRRRTSSTSNILHNNIVLRPHWATDHPTMARFMAMRHRQHQPADTVTIWPRPGSTQDKESAVGFIVFIRQRRQIFHHHVSAWWSKLWRHQSRQLYSYTIRHCCHIITSSSSIICHWTLPPTRRLALLRCLPRRSIISIRINSISNSCSNSSKNNSTHSTLINCRCHRSHHNRPCLHIIIVKNIRRIRHTLCRRR